jgi:hypothetical protein
MPYGKTPAKMGHKDSAMEMSPYKMGHKSAMKMGHESPAKNQNKGYAKQERKDLLQDNPVVRDASGGRSWMSKHSRSGMSPAKMGHDSAMKMGHKSPMKAAKPDFPDIDGDGDRKESMKKAAADKKKMKK